MKAIAPLHAWAILCAFIGVSQNIRGQRLIPPDRSSVPTGDHLKLAAENLRGTHFYLSRNETIEAFWSRYWPNHPSIEFRMAQLARAGVNYVREWSSYRTFVASS